MRRIQLAPFICVLVIVVGALALALLSKLPRTSYMRRADRGSSAPPSAVVRVLLISSPCYVIEVVSFIIYSVIYL